MEKAHQSRLSRRDALKIAGIAAFSLPSGGQAPTESKSFTVKLARTIDTARLLSVSPDGKRICTYSTRHPGESFEHRNGRWTNNNALADRSDEVSRLTELDSGETILAVSASCQG